MIQIVIQIEEINPDQLAIDVGKNSDLKGTPSPLELKWALMVNSRVVALLPDLVESQSYDVTMKAFVGTKDDQLDQQIIRSMIESERKKHP